MTTRRTRTVLTRKPASKKAAKKPAAKKAIKAKSAAKNLKKKVKASRAKKASWTLASIVDALFTRTGQGVPAKQLKEVVSHVGELMAQDPQVGAKLQSVGSRRLKTKTGAGQAARI